MCDEYAVAYLDADCPDVDDFLRLLLYYIINAEIADAKLPFRQTIMSHRFTVPSFDCRLMHQLLSDCREDESPLIRSQCPEVVLRNCLVVDTIRHRRCSYFAG